MNFIRVRTGGSQGHLASGLAGHRRRWSTYLAFKGHAKQLKEVGICRFDIGVNMQFGSLLVGHIRL